MAIVKVEQGLYQEKYYYNGDLLEEYHAWAEPGAATSDAKWRIEKRTYNVRWGGAHY